jgi:hypothetical protein
VIEELIIEFIEELIVELMIVELVMLMLTVVFRRIKLIEFQKGIKSQDDP